MANRILGVCSRGVVDARVVDARAQRGRVGRTKHPRAYSLTANFRTNLHVTLRVGSWATESPGWVVGCRVSEQEGASGVVRTCESIW